MSSQADRDLFDARILEQIETIRRIGNKRLRDRVALDDFTQEVIARAYEGRDRLRDSERLSHWIAGIARNVAREWARPSPMAAVEQSVPSGFDRSLFDQIAAWERRQALTDALNSLSPSERALLFAHYREGFSYAELAGKRQLSRSAVGVQLHRARRKLWRRLAAWLTSLVAVGGARGATATGGVVLMKTVTKIGIVAGLATITLALAIGGRVVQRAQEQSAESSSAPFTKETPTGRRGAGGPDSGDSSKESERETSLLLETEMANRAEKNVSVRESNAEQPPASSAFLSAKETGTPIQNGPTDKVAAALQALSPEQRQLYDTQKAAFLMYRGFALAVQEVLRSGVQAPPRPSPNAPAAEWEAWEKGARSAQAEVANRLRPLYRSMMAVSDEAERVITTLAPEAIREPSPGYTVIDKTKLTEAMGGRNPRDDLRLPPIGASIEIDGPDGRLRIRSGDGGAAWDSPRPSSR